MNIYLPDWYPAPRHIHPISFYELADFLQYALNESMKYARLKCLLPTETPSLYKFSRSLKKIRFFKSIDILDILIWAEQNKKPISGERLSEVLWPYDLVNLKKRFFETARPLAFSLLHSTGIAFLRSIPDNHSVYV